MAADGIHHGAQPQAVRFETVAIHLHGNFRLVAAEHIHDGHTGHALQLRRQHVLGQPPHFHEIVTPQPHGQHRAAAGGKFDDLRFADFPRQFAANARDGVLHIHRGQVHGNIIPKLDRHQRQAVLRGGGHFVHAFQRGGFFFDGIGHQVRHILRRGAGIGGEHIHQRRRGIRKQLNG